jgi:acetyl-CoA C-acetyltransferase
MVDNHLTGTASPAREGRHNVARIVALLARPGDMPSTTVNEAMAAQALLSARYLGIDGLNVNGGAIAVGHPFGLTRARITTTLINSLQFHDKQFGLETLYVGGGQGMTMALERLA